MSVKIGKNDKRIFTRIVKGSKVQNDVSLAAAKRLVHMGWSIEDDRFEPNGFPRQSHIEQDIPVAKTLEESPVYGEKPIEPELEINNEPEVFEASEPALTQDEIDDIWSAANRARGIAKIEELKKEHGGLDATLDKHFENRIKKLTKK